MNLNNLGMFSAYGLNITRVQDKTPTAASLEEAGNFLLKQAEELKKPKISPRLKAILDFADKQDILVGKIVREYGRVSSYYDIESDSNDGDYGTTWEKTPNKVADVLTKGVMSVGSGYFCEYYLVKEDSYSRPTVLLTPNETA